MREGVGCGSLEDFSYILNFMHVKAFMCLCQCFIRYTVDLISAKISSSLVYRLQSRKTRSGFSTDYFDIEEPDFTSPTTLCKLCVLIVQGNRSTPAHSEKWSPLVALLAAMRARSLHRSR